MRSTTRTLLVTSLALSALLVCGQSIAAKPGALSVKLQVPAHVDGLTSVGVELTLPAGVRAVDGRAFFDSDAAQLIGVAPQGGGVGLEPVAIKGGAAFGAYGLSSRNGATTLRLIIKPMRAGRLSLRVVVDRSADAARAAQQVRDVDADGAISADDLDFARAAWTLARANGGSCSTGAALAGDANADGCVDILDIQGLAANQLARVPGVSRASASVGTPLPPAARAAAGPSLTIVVTSALDTADAAAGDRVCADAQGRCTLRAAITEANWNPGPDRIEFNLPGPAPVAIQLTGSGLPIIHDRSGGTVIDGYSQPGSRVNTAKVGSNAVAGIEIRGTGNSPQADIFRITSADNTIRGFLLNRTHYAIFLDGHDAANNLIAGNLIGFTRAGKVHSYRGEHAIRLNVGAHDNRIGTPNLADRNVAGNFKHAVDMYGPGTDNNVVQNNVLCLTPTGMATAACATGVDHNFGPKHNLVGGLGENERNVIGRTSLNGVEISHGWDPDGLDSSARWQNNSNRVLGNWIGFRGDGHYAAKFRSGQGKPNSNDQNGVNVYDGSNFNIVEGNTIASVYDGIQTMSPNTTGTVIRNNIIGQSPRGQAAPFRRYGIVVRENSKTHTIEGNIIRNGGVYGIGLTHRGVRFVRLSGNIISNMSGAAIYLAPNPQGQGGANNLLAAPVVTSAITTRVQGTGIAGATVEVYRASRKKGRGLPIALLGSGLVGKDGRWSVAISTARNNRVTALQIAPNNDTSGLASNVKVKRP